MPSSTRIRAGSLRQAFTLIEIVIVVVIAMMITLLAVPSLTGVLADKRLRRSLDSFNGLVREAQERSMAEHRAYLIAWGDGQILLRPEALAPDEDDKPTAVFPVPRGSSLAISFPAALEKDPPAEWIFWPSGTCELAVVQFKGRDGEWKAKYSPLTGAEKLENYVAR